MPLVQVEVRNEYGLGMPELYNEVNREDPKAVLDGVAVAGLVGILRQLGDLAEFAAEVFHGLQEQVLVTSSRSHKLIVRLHNVEAALPPLEKAILAIRSHLHFAYTAGSYWHVRLRSEKNHFILSDLPRCIMDSYEKSRDPPRLHLLDKFDPGGAGSCFKRYSDPSFFKRASGGLDEAYIQNARREKKDRRSKKKRTSRRSKEVIYNVPISDHCGRMQFASPSIDGQSSSRDVSVFGSEIRSEMENHTNSFDLRTESNYIECVFHPSYSTQSEENEPKEVFSKLKRHHNDSLDSASIGEQSGVVDDNNRHSLSEMQTGPRSSSVTWDEKAEIMEPTTQPHETTEILRTTIDLHTQQEGALNFRAVDQMDFDFDEELMPASVSGGDHHDDVDSETDYYMDALNTIESESETDVDCQTKIKLQQYSSVNEKAEDGRPTASHLDAPSVTSESHVPAYTSLDKVILGPTPNLTSPETHVFSPIIETSEDQTRSVPSESNAYVQMPGRSGVSLIPHSSPDILISENGDIKDDSNAVSVASNGSPSRSSQSNLASLNDKILTTCESPKPRSASSGVHPVMFWTNGGLLGLEPSKPPDFSVSSAAQQEIAAKSKDGVAKLSNESSNLQENGGMVRASIVAQSSDFLHSNSLNYDREHDFCSDSALTPVIKGRDNLDELEASKQDSNSSVRIFEFSNRLLVNGLRRQVSLVGDEKLASSVRSDVSEQISMQRASLTFMGKSFSESFGSGSTIMSPCSSPPLEHMKILFQPIDGFETSKLKLKFPDGSSCHEGSGDMFPSFQLVPEPAISLHDSGSDSDDDTFCISSPDISDDCQSHYSESNFEQWESDDSPGRKDHQLNGDCNISSKQSVSQIIGSRSHGDFLENSGLQSTLTEDGVEPFLSGRLLDLPNFDTLNTSLNQEISNSGRMYVLDSHYPTDPTPPPPPLPPMQWRGIKSHPDVATEREDTLSEALNYALDLKPPAPTISQQPKPAPLKQDNFIETIERTPKTKKPDWQRQNGHKGADQISNEKILDEKDDFLQQIRTKSFNLRRTATARPTLTSSAPTSFKVTAILEKAIAIREAVGSDDGDDYDNWSDD